MQPKTTEFLDDPLETPLGDGDFATYMDKKRLEYYKKEAADAAGKS